MTLVATEPLEGEVLPKVIDVLQIQVQRLDVTLVRMYRSLQSVGSESPEWPMAAAPSRPTSGHIAEAEKLNAEALSQVLAIRAQIARLERVAKVVVTESPKSLEGQSEPEVIKLPSPPQTARPRPGSPSARGRDTISLQPFNDALVSPQKVESLVQKVEAATKAGEDTWTNRPPSFSNLPVSYLTDNSKRGGPLTTRYGGAPMVPPTSMRASSPAIQQRPVLVSSTPSSIRCSSTASPSRQRPGSVLAATPPRLRSKSPAPVLNAAACRAPSPLRQSVAMAPVGTPQRPQLSTQRSMAMQPIAPVLPAPNGPAPAVTVQQLPSPILTAAIAYSNPGEGGLTKPALPEPTLGPPMALREVAGLPVTIPGLPNSSPFKPEYTWRDLLGN